MLAKVLSVLAFLLHRSEAGAGDSHDSDRTSALRAAAVFEGLMAGMGVRTDLHALSRAIGPNRQICGLHFENIFMHIDVGLSSFVRTINTDLNNNNAFEHTQLITASMQRIAQGLRGFAAACQHCHLATSSRLSMLAARLAHVTDSTLEEQSGSNASLRTSVNVGGVDRGAELLEAGVAFRSGRYQQAGLALVLALAHPLGSSVEGDDPFDRVSHHWTEFDPEGRVRSENELHDIWRERAAQKSRQLREVVRALENAPPTEADPRDIDRASPLCCCCWAKTADEQQATLHMDHSL